jgi:hypothetical protein
VHEVARSARVRRRVCRQLVVGDYDAVICCHYKTVRRDKQSESLEKA